MNDFFLTPLEKAINLYLSLDPLSTLRLKNLEGKCIAIELLPFHFKFYAIFNMNGVILTQALDKEPDARLSGTPLQMVGLAFTKENRQHFFAEDVVIEGDAGVAQLVIELLDELHIEWEEPLSSLIGDTPTHHISQIFQKTKDWLRQRDERFSENVTDYIHEEARWLPTKEALSDFFHDVDEFVSDLDRLKAEIRQLQKEATLDEEDNL